MARCGWLVIPRLRVGLVPRFPNSVWEPHPRNSVSRSQTDARCGSRRCQAPRNRVSRTSVTKRSLVTRGEEPARQCQILHRHSPSRRTYADFPGFVQRRAPRNPPTALSDVSMIADMVDPLSALGWVGGTDTSVRASKQKCLCCQDTPNSGAPGAHGGVLQWYTVHTF
jgi:hypothetical protein